MRRAGEFQGQKLAVGVGEARPPIHCLCGRVVSSGLDVYGAHALFCAERPHLGQSSLAQACPAKWLADKQVIHERIRAAILHAVAQGHDHIADILRAGLNEKHEPKSFVSKERSESFRRAPAI